MANEKRVEIEEDSISRTPETTTRFEDKRLGVRYRRKALNSISRKDGTWRTRGPLYILSGTALDKIADKHVYYQVDNYIENNADNFVSAFVDTFVNGRAGENAYRHFYDHVYDHVYNHAETYAAPYTPLGIPPILPGKVQI